MGSIDINELTKESQQLPLWRRNLYLTMVGGAIVIAAALVFIAMSLYRNSDAMRLDLSRPGYQEVRDQVSRDRDVSSFSPTGPLTPAVLDEFNRKYDEALDHVHGVNAFEADALSDSALSLPQVAP